MHRDWYFATEEEIPAGHLSIPEKQQSATKLFGDPLYMSSGVS